MVIFPLRYQGLRLDISGDRKFCRRERVEKKDYTYVYVISFKSQRWINKGRKLMKGFLKLIRPCLMLDLRSLTVVLRSASRLFRKETINNYSWFGSTAGHSCHREWKDFSLLCPRAQRDLIGAPVKARNMGEMGTLFSCFKDYMSHPSCISLPTE